MESDASFWAGYIGNPQTVRYLKKISKKENIGQVYLFEGPEGIGKHTASLYLAAAVICEHFGCGQCQDCKNIFKDVHPNLFDVSPEGNFITIDQIREIQHELSLKSFGEKERFVILDGVDHLKLEAANSLLKTIEEPPPRSIFILITSRPDLVLPTIISRSQGLLFRPAPLDKICVRLQEIFDKNEEEIKLATSISGGLYGRAFNYLQDDWRKDKRAFLIDTLINIDDMDSLELSERADKLAEIINKPVQGLKKKHSREAAAFMNELGKSDKRIAKRLELKLKRQINQMASQNQDEIAQILFTWYRDILALGNIKNKNLQIINIDFKKELQKKTVKLNNFQVIKAMEEINRTREIFLSNVNIQLGIEALLLRLKQIEA